MRLFLDTLQLLLKPKFSVVEKIKTIGSTYMVAAGLQPGKEEVRKGIGRVEVRRGTWREEVKMGTAREKVRRSTARKKVMRGTGRDEVMRCTGS